MKICRQEKSPATDKLHFRTRRWKESQGVVMPKCNVELSHVQVEQLAALWTLRQDHGNCECQFVTEKES